MIVYTAYVIIACTLPDILISCKIVPQERKYLFAFYDNAVHGIIAFVSWLSFRETTSHISKLCFRAVMIEAFICSIFACIIDIDHFICAQSLSFKKVMDYKQDIHGRPFLHNSALIPLVALTIYTILKVRAHGLALPCSFDHLSWWNQRDNAFALCPADWLVPLSVIAISSHHLRDSIRRGLTIGNPLPICDARRFSTRPVPYLIYVSVCALLPPLLAVIWKAATNEGPLRASRDITII